MVFAGVTDDGTTLDAEQCRRLFSLSASEAEIDSTETCPAEVLDKLSANAVTNYIGDSQKRDLTTFETEINKLDRWAEDKRAGLKSELGDLDDRVKELKRAARLASNLPEKLRLEKERKAMEAKHDEAWRIYEEQARAIDREKDKLLDETQSSLAPKTSEWVLFTVRWTLQS